MAPIRRAILNPRPRRALPVLIFAAALCAANGQQHQPQSQKPFWMDDPSTLPKSTARIEQGKAFPADYEVIARWHDVHAIPLLKTQFDKTKDPATRAKIASVLLGLGVKGGPYWDYLADNAQNVLQDPPPTPFDLDANGIATAPSSTFSEWAKKHNMSVEMAFYNATTEALGAITYLGLSDDPRAVPILRKALASKNYLIQAKAARGLANLHDTASVPAIIRVCQNAPKQTASVIAESLVYFDDPVAQHAVDLYVPQATAEELREARAHDHTAYR
jgi:hypothetical protein